MVPQDSDHPLVHLPCAEQRTCTPCTPASGGHVANDDRQQTGGSYLYIAVDTADESSRATAYDILLYKPKPNMLHALYFSCAEIIECGVLKAQKPVTWGGKTKASRMAVVDRGYSTQLGLSLQQKLNSHTSNMYPRVVFSFGLHRAGWQQENACVPDSHSTSTHLSPKP